MEFNDVKKLVKLLEKSAISEIELETEGSKIRLRKADPQVFAAAPTMVQAAIPAAAPAVAAQAAPAEVSVESKPSYNEVKSPMVGTFYTAPAPDADPYVQVGDTVKPGQTLCIIEAMKLMNEIEADVAGRVVEINVQNESPVEFGQVLFSIDTKA